MQNSFCTSKHRSDENMHSLDKGVNSMKTKRQLIYIDVLRNTLRGDIVYCGFIFIESGTPFCDCVDTHSYQVSRLATSWHCVWRSHLELLIAIVP